MTVTRRKDGTIGYVELANPPVNAINREMRQGLLDAVQWAEAEALERVILSGAGRGFAAGADAREFDRAPEPPHLPEVLRRIELSPVPWIAAVHGAALGGGAEILLACRYRIARPDATLGLPEVTLGVVPGAGGTQRLPRLVGMPAALDLIPTGRAVSGDAALRIGLVDALADDPVALASAVPSKRLKLALPVGQRPASTAPEVAFTDARNAAERSMSGQIAPRRAIELLELAQTQPLDDGLRHERETFLALRQSDQARALRHVFFAERAARAPAWLTATAQPPRHVAITGDATVVAGIACAMLKAGFRVTILATGAAEREHAQIDRIIADSLSRESLDTDGADQMRARLAIREDFGAAGAADLAVEAAFADLQATRAAMERLQAALPGHTILATTTPGLDVDQIARGLDEPSRLLGLRLPAPAHLTRLLEIVRGAATSDAALATAFALARTLRKVPVLSDAGVGPIGDRILARRDEAADTLLSLGARPQEVHAAMVAFGFPAGPAAADTPRDPLAGAIPAAEISRRLVLAMIDGVAGVLEAGRGADIDLVSVLGHGFPRWRGGLIHYADTLGAGRILAELQELASQGGAAARTPDPVIEDCARRGIPLSEWRR